MKDLIIIQNSIATTLKFRISYINEYINSGGNVFVISPNDCENSKRELVNKGCKVYWVPAFKGVLGTLISSLFMNAHLMRLKFNLDNPSVVCHFLVSYLMCFVSLFIFYKKVLVSIEGLGFIFLKGGAPVRIMRFLLNQPNITRVFCNNDERDILGNQSDLVSGGIGVDTKFFSRSSHKNNSLAPPIRLIYVGRLIKDKGIKDVFDIFRGLLDYGCTLTVVGDIYPNNPSSLTSKDIENYNSEFGDLVSFKGYVADPKVFYEESDILLLPSKREGFPVCVMEANSMGIPVVVYNVPGSRDAVVNFCNGVCVELGDITAAVIATLQIYNDGNMSDIISSSRSYAEEYFDREAKTKYFLELLK
ncbi:glycosyltransferase [Vibrio cyclitrophicus]